MGFWDDKLGKPQPPNTAAPGAWWQTQQQQQQNYAPQVQQQQQMQPVQRQQQQMQVNHPDQGYAPTDSGFVSTRKSNKVADQCPRCYSYDYVEIAAEPAPGSIYTLPGKTVRCMTCNYPGIDTSEGVIGSQAGTKGVGSVGKVQVVSHRVREQGGRNQNSFAGFNESSQAEGSHVIKIM